MKFVVHDHINNTAYVVSDFRDVNGEFLSGESSKAMITNQGICFFSLHKSWYDDVKLAIAVSLDRKLRQVFGKGLSAATFGHSDCTDEDDEEFLSAIKNRIPDIKTILISCEAESDKPQLDAVTKIFSKDRNEVIVQQAGATEEDKKEPSEGWQAFRIQLNGLFKEAIDECMPPTAKYNCDF